MPCLISASNLNTVILLVIKKTYKKLATVNSDPSSQTDEYTANDKASKAQNVWYGDSADS